MADDLDDDLDALDLTERERKHAARIATISKSYGWPVRLPFDLALGLDEPEDVFKRHGYDANGAIELMQRPTFVRLLKQFKELVVNEGISFRTKAKLAAEELLLEAYAIATDANVAASTRLDAIKWHAKVGGLEPRENDKGGGGGGGFKLNITFSDKRQEITIEGDSSVIPENSDTQVLAAPED